MIEINGNKMFPVYFLIMIKINFSQIQLIKLKINLIQVISIHKLNFIFQLLITMEILFLLFNYLINFIYVYLHQLKQETFFKKEKTIFKDVY